jgi:hypothetical protein
VQGLPAGGGVIVIAAIAACLLIAGATAAIARLVEGTWLRRATKTELLVHTVDERTIKGVLVETGREGLILRAAAYLEGQSSIPLAGETYIPRERVAFVQKG